MAVVRCRCCDQFIDLDWHCEGEWDEKTGEFTCFDCVVREEQERAIFDPLDKD